MRKRSMKACRLYAVKDAARRTVPALLLDTALWDRTPADDGIAYKPAPADETWGTTLDADSGARRGMLVITTRPGTPADDFDDLADALTALAEDPAALAVPDGGPDAVTALTERLAPQLMPDVLREARILMTWADHTGGAKKYKCPECGTPVTMHGAIRLRAHRVNGVSCPRSNTPLTRAEREQAVD